MEPEPHAPVPRTVTARIVLKRPGGSIETDLEMPLAPVPIANILPLARALTDRLVELRVIEVEAEGRKISCTKGCGACCRQIVPISEVEARRIRDLVESLPEPRRSVIRSRFAESRERLDAAGLLDSLLSNERLTWDKEARGRIGIDYFRLGLPCPFLEDESCSIHPDRPLSCREYLVTSPASSCAVPEKKKIEGVEFPTKVWTSFARLSGPGPRPDSVRWVPLALAPEWAEAYPDDPPPRLAPELLRDLIGPLDAAAPRPAVPETQAPQR